jgi:hypothetical protein
LVRDRQRELLAAAAQRQLVGHRLDGRSLRVRTGWLLVRAGSRLARPPVSADCVPNLSTPC